MGNSKRWVCECGFVTDDYFEFAEHECEEDKK